MAYHGTKFRWVNRRVHTANAVFGEVLYEPGGGCGPRVQRDFELILIHSGEGHVTLNKVVHHIKAGTVSLFTPGNHDYFQYSTYTETHHSWCTIRSMFMPKNLRNQLKQPLVSVPSSSLFRALFDEALKLKPTPNNPLDALIEHLASCAFAEFLHSSSKKNRELMGDPAVNAFLRHVGDHFADENCLSAARLASCVSRNTLLNKFHQTMQTTPAHYLWKVRVERGISMLAETGQTVAEIAYRCGFKNPFHFSRLLKQQTGRSPKAIRSHAWARES
jgi:AraC family transcriptional regulator of arabinose operon